jgi:hypothetical protein
MDVKRSLGQAKERLSAMASQISGSGSTSPQFPDFDALPKVEGQPQGCMWGQFDKDGKKDEIGSEYPHYAHAYAHTQPPPHPHAPSTLQFSFSYLNRQRLTTLIQH